MYKERKQIVGLWRFPGTVSVRKLAEVAEQIQSKESGYDELYIRPVAEEGLGLGVSYSITEGDDPQVALEDYIAETKLYFEERAGLTPAGWDLAARVWRAE